jgi:hypothetical protein
MSTSQKTGIFFCLLILASLFLNWAFYPDIEKYFTAFFSQNNYYGKPGKLLLFFALSGIAFHVYKKPWTQRLNLIFGAFCMAYAVKTYLLYTSGYDGYVPKPQPGIFVMLVGCLGHLVTSVSALTVTKIVEKIPMDEELQEKQKQPA